MIFATLVLGAILCAAMAALAVVRFFKADSLSEMAERPYYLLMAGVSGVMAAFIFLLAAYL